MILEKGSKGDAVKEWQTLLTAHGYTNTVDGDYGPSTERATRSFQVSAHLIADGKVGDATRAAMERMAPAPLLIRKPIVGLGGNTLGANEAVITRLCPKFQPLVRSFIDIAAQDGTTLRVVQGVRTFQEQDRLYAEGRTLPGVKVTNAKGGQSNHNFGVAADLAPIVNGLVSWNDSLFKSYGEWAQAAGVEWGGSWAHFRDLPHIQLPHLPPTATVLSWFRAGGMQEVWEKLG